MFQVFSILPKYLSNNYVVQSATISNVKIQIKIFVSNQMFCARAWMTGIEMKVTTQGIREDRLEEEI